MVKSAISSQSQKLCERCGTPLGRFAPGAVCARCLLESGLSDLEKEPTAAPGNLAGKTLGRLGNYELLEEIAQGGMGVVYRARDVTVNRIVALKMIRTGQFASERELKRFQAEAEAAAQLDHPNIVPLYEFGEIDGRRFLSMKLVDGLDLVRRLHGAPMDGRPIAELMAMLARAIHHAHQRGVLHRDLKPANILVDAQGEPHVTDFGLAKIRGQDSGLTLSSDVLGSPNYMAPEQAAGSSQVTTAADIYSLGAIMYEILTGRPPFKSATPLETMRKVMQEELIPPHTLYTFADRDLETICLKCMEKDPSRRYSTALELAQDLEHWLHHEPISARPATRVERVTKWMRRNPKIATLVVLLHVVFVVGLGGILMVCVRLASANRAKERANAQLAKNVRDFEWQKIDQLIGSARRADALAYLSRFLRQDPHDRLAATRIISMMSGCNFALPAIAPLRHGVGVNTAVFSADGQRALTAADDGKARVWELASGRVLSTMAHPVKVIAAWFVADERQILTSCQDGTSRLWDSTEARVLFEFPSGPAGQGGVVSPEGKWVGLRETDASIQVWDVLKHQRVGRPLRVPATVRCVAFSPNTDAITIAAADGTVCVWKVETSELITSPPKLSGDITTSVFSPDGKMLAIAWGGMLTLWDFQSGTKLREFKADDGQILEIEFTPDGRRLISMAYDRPPKIWDVASGQTLGQPIEAERPFAYFRISPDGKRLATQSQSGVARVWDAFSGLALSEPFEHDGPLTDLKFSPDGQFLLTASQDGTARIWQVQVGHSDVLALETKAAYPSACFSEGARRVILSTEGRAEIFDIQSGRRVGKPMEHLGEICSMKLSADGRKLATASWDNTGRVWDAQTGEPLTPPLPHRWRLFAIAFSPDGRLLATGAADSAARLWSVESGEALGPELLHQDQVMDVQFRPDSRALLTASVDSTARLWSTENGQPLWPEPLRHKGIVWTAEFSPDGQRIVTASADKSAMVWDATTRRPLSRPMLHERGIYQAHFSPDGKRVLTCSEDGSARVWDAGTGEPISQPMRHKDKVGLAFFSGDGRWVLTGSHDGEVRLWDARTGYALSEPLKNKGQITCMQFSPDGRRCLSIAGSDALRIWEVRDAPAPVPPWFCDFVEGVAGRRLNPQGEREPVPSTTLQQLKLLCSAGNEADFYSRWTHWFLFARFQEPAGGEFVK